jgi:hypothetical protein
MVIPKTYQDAISVLAEDHLQVDPSIKEVWSFDDPAEAVVRFVEVSEAPELPSENGAVTAVVFGPSPDFPYRSEIALLTREDWDRVHAGSLRLPHGWELSRARKVEG